VTLRLNYVFFSCGTLSAKFFPAVNKSNLVLASPYHIGGFTDTALIIERLDAEITRLQQAKALLTGTDIRKGPGRPKASDAVSKPVAVKLTQRVMSAIHSTPRRVPELS
jgi:hypothetical protein